MITEELGFQSTVHEPCLYYKRDKDDNLTLILRQVDDFLVANKDSKECDRIGELIQAQMTNPLNQLGTIRKFNGVNSFQAIVPYMGQEKGSFFKGEFLPQNGT
jgi:hypothetical protein